jgi:hypothetical protein
MQSVYNKKKFSQATCYLKPTVDIRAIKELARNFAPIGEMRGTYRVLVVKPERKGPLRTAWQWDNNIKMDLQEWCKN